MPESRIAGNLGRLPQRPEGQRFAIQYSHDYAPAPPPVYPVDVSQGITEWGMLSNGPDPTLTNPPAGVDPNQGVGDCGPAGVAHERMLAGAHPTANEVVALYWQYDQGQDNGVVIADFLLWLFQQQLIEGFAPVHHTAVDAVMDQFKRGVLLGVSLTDDADARFSTGLPWTVSQGEAPNPSLGHVVLQIGTAHAGGDGLVVTWGADQVADGGWLGACVDEAWVILTKEDLGDAAYAALLADLNALPNVVDNPPAPPAPVPPVPPTPPEPPAPPSPPSPAPPDIHGFVQEVKHIVREAVTKIEQAAEAVIDAVEGG